MWSVAYGRARDRAAARSPSGGRRPLRRCLRRRLDFIQSNSAVIWIPLSGFVAKIDARLLRDFINIM